MLKIIDINKNKPHHVGNAICNICNHKWIAVFPVEADSTKLECSECHNMDSTVELISVDDKREQLKHADIWWESLGEYKLVAERAIKMLMLLRRNRVK